MENRIAPILNFSYYLKKIFTREECDKIFGEHSDRIWSKYWCYVSKCDMMYFNMNFSTFNEGAYAELRPNLDEWLTKNLESVLTPAGFKIVPV
jgi:hypothetical protein